MKWYPRSAGLVAFTLNCEVEIQVQHIPVYIVYGTNTIDPAVAETTYLQNFNHEKSCEKSNTTWTRNVFCIILH